MTPVTLSDVVPVARVLARAYAPGGTAPRARSALLVPLFLAGLVLLPGYVHHSRRVVVRVARRGARGASLVVLRALALGAVLVVLGMLALTSRTAAVLVVTAVVVVWLLVVAGAVMMVPRALEALGGHEHGRRSRVSRRRDREQLRRAGWTVDSAASIQASGGLLVIRDHLRSALPSGDVVAVQAATEKHAAVYRRLGFDALETQPLRLLGTVP